MQQQQQSVLMITWPPMHLCWTREQTAAAATRHRTQIGHAKRPIRLVEGEGSRGRKKKEKEEKEEEKKLQLFYIFARADKQLIEGESGSGRAKSAQSLEEYKACNGGEIDLVLLAVSLCVTICVMYVAILSYCIMCRIWVHWLEDASGGSTTRRQWYLWWWCCSSIRGRRRGLIDICRNQLPEQFFSALSLSLSLSC